MAFTLSIGQPAPDFELPGVDGRNQRLSDFDGCRLLVVVFSCNHCPYVVGSEERMIKFALTYAPKGVAFVAVNSNETENHPTDSFEHMVERAREKNFPFPYLRDETQEIALAYGALRTPHYFLFDKDESGRRRLRYTGRMDDNPRTPRRPKDARAGRFGGRAAGRPPTAGGGDEPDRLQREVEGQTRQVDAAGGVRSGLAGGGQ